MAARTGAPAGLVALRWLVPTAASELLHDFEPRDPSQPALRAMIEVAGFEVLEERDAFLAGLCRLVWTRGEQAVSTAAAAVGRRARPGPRARRLRRTAAHAARQ